MDPEQIEEGKFNRGRPFGGKYPGCSLEGTKIEMSLNEGFKSKYLMHKAEMKPHVKDGKLTFKGSYQSHCNYITRMEIMPSSPAPASSPTPAPKLAACTV